MPYIDTASANREKEQDIRMKCSILKRDSENERSEAGRAICETPTLRQGCPVED